MLTLHLPLSSWSFHNSPLSGLNIKNFGATGVGKTLDTKAINDAIDSAAKKGGGPVYFPPGTYLSFSIRLNSSIGLYFDKGLLAADLSANGKYGDAD